MIRTYYSKLPKLNSLIKEELDKLMIDEIFDRKLETAYEEINDNINGFRVKTFRFKTNSNEQYDLNFFFNWTDVEIKMSNNKKLIDIIQTQNEEFIRSVDIGFTLTSRITKDSDIDDELYNLNTNKNVVKSALSRVRNSGCVPPKKKHIS